MNPAVSPHIFCLLLLGARKGIWFIGCPTALCQTDGTGTERVNQAL